MGLRIIKSNSYQFGISQTNIFRKLFYETKLI
jgi:hypothetical protein